MGYDLHITRRDDWSDDDDNNISMDEWVGYCISDSDMEISGKAEIALADKSILSYSNPGLAVWKRYSKNTETNKAWFDLRNGNIVVKNPDDEIVAKMIAISKALNGKVQGDDGEIYGGVNDEFG